jgi:hypothetical protein
MSVGFCHILYENHAYQLETVGNGSYCSHTKAVLNGNIKSEKLLCWSPLCFVSKLMEII